MKKIWLGFFIGGIALGAVQEGPVLVKVPADTAERLPSWGVDFAPDHFSHPYYKVGYVEPGALAGLPGGLRAQVEILDELRWAVGGYDRHDLRPIPADLVNFAEGYHDYAALTEELKSLVAKYPTFLRLESAGKSVQGRELWYVVLSENVAVPKGKPKLIYHANMHGDEVVGRELMIYFLRHLLDEFGTHERITQMVRHAEIFIMPSMNPDGFELRRRANANGKDLNRNFPDRFTSTNDDPKGRQIEVGHMMELARKNHFVYGLNWHGGEICFNLPWGNIKNDTPEKRYPDDWFFHPIGREYTELNRPMHSNHHSNFDHGLTYGYEWYPVNGGINDWFNWFRRSVHSVVELTVTKWPKASELPKHWDDNREAMITYLWRGMRGVHLEVRDATGALVQSPTVHLSTSPRRPLRFDDGYVHRVTGDGWHDVRVEAPGFQPVSLKVASTYFDGTFTRVTLGRSVK